MLLPSSFLVRLPFVIVGLLALSTALIDLTAIPAVQLELASVALD